MSFPIIRVQTDSDIHTGRVSLEVELCDMETYVQGKQTRDRVKVATTLPFKCDRDDLLAWGTEALRIALSSWESFGTIAPVAEPDGGEPQRM